MSIPAFAIRRPVAVAMLFLAVAFIGVISYVRLPIDLLPDVSYPRLVIYTTYPDVGPAEVERFVTQRVEEAVAAVPNVERMESVSREGVSLVTLRFGWGADMDFAALNVREKLDNARGTFPETADRPVVLRTDPGAEPIITLAVTGSRDIAALKDLSEAVFKRRLEQLDGVAEAGVVGGLDREIQVEVHPRALASQGITLDEVAGALAAANQNAPGGTILRGRYRYALRTLGEFQQVEQIENVPIRPAGRAGTLRIGDIATVVDGFEERESLARFNGVESVGLLIYKDAGANTVEVERQVQQVLAQLRAEYPDVRLEIAASQAGFVSEAIDSVVQNLIQGALLAFLVLFLFLRDIRYPVAIGLAIPISVLTTFALLDVFNVSLNVMSLGGLALGVGMLVDNSIVVLENVFRHRELGLDARDAARAGADEVTGAITSSTLTTVAVFGPIVYVEGVAGQLFGAVSLAVTCSLLASLAVALILNPMMASGWGGEVRAEGGVVTRRLNRLLGPVLDVFDRWFGRFQTGYERSLAWALAHRGRVIGVAVALLLVAVALGLTLPRSVLPDVDQGAFRARLTLPRGTPLQQTADVAARVDSMLRADPAVAATFATVGRRVAAQGLADDEERGLNTAIIEVRLADGVTTADVVARVRAALGWLDPETVALETGQATALGKLLGGAETDLAVRIRADDLDAGITHARTVVHRLAQVPALTNVRLGTVMGQPEIQVMIDRDRAAMHGIEPLRVAQTVERAMRGTVATEFVDFDRKIPIVVRLPEAARRSLETFETVLVDGVPLARLVTTREALGPTEIRRVDQSRMVPVYADVAHGDLAGAVRAARDALRATPAPRDIRVDIGGENEEMRRAFIRLAFAFALAVLLVYMILAAEFESLLHPFTVLLSVPFALIGALAALWLAGGGLNAMSLIGLVILVGMVDNDAIVKVVFINQMRKAGMGVREAILAAGKARMRPIVMNTVTALVGVMPMAIGIGSGAELRQPLAIAIFGGLFTSTALTLLVLPVCYELVEETRQRIRAWFRLAPVEAADA